MKTTGSKTPRVDAAQKNRTHMTGNDCFWWVQSDFARTLEGELNETRQLLAEKNETANVFMRQVKKLQAELAGCNLDMKTKTEKSPLAPLIKLCAQERGKKTEVLRKLISRNTIANWGQVNDWLHTDPAKRRNPRAETLKVLLEIQKELT